MKLTAKERARAVELLGKLDARQREKLLKTMERQVLANDITKRVGKMRRLEIVDDKKIVKHYGLPIPAGAGNRKGKGGGETA